VGDRAGDGGGCHLVATGFGDLLGVGGVVGYFQYLHQAQRLEQAADLTVGVDDDDGRAATALLGNADRGQPTQERRVHGGTVRQVDDEVAGLAALAQVIGELAQRHAVLEGAASTDAYDRHIAAVEDGALDIPGGGGRSGG